MHIINGFLIREVADERVAVPIGDAVRKFSGVISLNDSAAFLLQLLHTEQTPETLLSAMLNEFEIDEGTARQDITEFLSIMDSLGLLVDAPL
ncbi:MAG: PqqD family protein [Faecousia sp.]